MSGFLFHFSNKKGEAVSDIILLDAGTLKEASEEIDRYIEEHPYDRYVDRYKDKKDIIELYEYEIKNNWIIEEDKD